MRGDHPFLKPEKATRLLLWSCYGGMLGIAASVNVTPVCLTSIAETFDLDYAQQGLLIGCTFWGYILSLSVVAPLTDRFGPEPFLEFGSVVQLSGFLLFAFAWDPSVLAWGALLMGLGGGTQETIVSPVVCELFPDRKTHEVNILHGVYAFGAVGVILLSGYMLRIGEPGGLVTNSESWRWAYIALSVIPVLFGLGYFVSLRLARVTVAYPHSESYGKTCKRLLRWGFLAFAVAMFCAGGTEISIAQWLPSYLENILDWSREAGATGLLIVSLCMGIGRLCIGRMADYLSAATILTVASAGCCVGLLILGNVSSSIAASVTIALLGFFMGMLWPTVMALASDTFPNTGATMFAMLAVAGNSGGIVTAGAVGFVAHQFDLRIALISLIVVPTVAAAAFFAIWYRHHRVSNRTA